MYIEEHERRPRIPFRNLSRFREFCSTLGILSIEMYNAQNENDQETEHAAAKDIAKTIAEFGNWVDEIHR